jgi:hypothetical protein
MALTPPTTTAVRTPARARTHETRLLRGGPDGNEQLTAVTGVILIVLLAALGITIIKIGQLLSEHLFLGLLLLGPVALKMGSTGYRFVRYYTHDREYVRRGPPELWLRLLAPAVVATTVAVFATGVWLLIVGPFHRDPALLLHKVTFILWLGAMGLHVLGHLPELPRQVRSPSLDGTAPGGGQAGRGARAVLLAGAIVGGIVLAIALIPTFHTWTSEIGLLHHHHG